ncbi:MAG: S-layer y protein [Patescibacteria group bacterium]|nr:S-layer y protein [Patescibacteria group bacterium]
MGNEKFFQGVRKKAAGTLAFILTFSTFQPFLAYAVAANLSGTNNGYVNATNSGSYVAEFDLAGSTLNPGDYVYVEVLSGASVIATGASVPATGGEGTGSISPIDFSSFDDGTYSLSGSVFDSGAVVTTPSISGTTVTKDTVVPVVTSTGTLSASTGSVDFSGITVTEANFSGATLSYSGVGGAVETGTVNLDGTVSELTGSVVGLSSNSTYAYSLTVTDSAGNQATVPAGTFSTAFSWDGLYATVGSGITAAGIANNFTGVTNSNVTAYSGLFFEKTGLGKITFSGALDLTNSGTISFLQNLGSYLDMSGGYVGLTVSSGSTASGSIFQSAGATIEVYFSSQVFASGSLDPSAIVVKDNEGNVLDSSGMLSNVTCAVGMGGEQTCFFEASHFTTFDFKPTLPSVSVASGNSISGALAKTGDTVTITFTGSESLTGVTATMSGVNNGSPLTVAGSGASWTATGTVTSTGSVSGATFAIDFSDLLGNAGDTVTSTTDSSSVSFDPTAPTAVLSSSAPSTISGAISVDVEFSETATGFILGDISVTNGIASSLTPTSSTGYSFTVTPSSYSGAMTVSIGTGTFTDEAGNPNAAASNTLAYTVSVTDTDNPVVTVGSHTDNQNVTGSTASLTGSVTDTGGIAGVSVNGNPAQVSSGTWSLTLTGLTAGNNAVEAVATDLSGNTGSVSVNLIRVVAAPTNQTATLSGSTEAVIAFSTDLVATGSVQYGTNSGSLGSSAVGSTAATSHQIPLTGLSSDTTYYYRTFGLSDGNTGSLSEISSFKTPAVVDVLASSGTVTATGSAYLSGATSTGATFTNTGTLVITSLGSSGSVQLAMSGLTISASGSWDGNFQAPTSTSNTATGAGTGYTFTGTVYQIGSPNAELTLTGGSAATVTVNVGTSFSGTTLKVYRSTDGGTVYSYLAECTVDSSGNCTFSSSQFSLFGFAAPSDTTPNAFSFTDVTGSEFSTIIESAAITVSGINAASTISVTGGSYSVNGGSYTTATGTVNNGDTVKAKATTAAAYSTAVNVAVTIGGVSDTFTVTTKTSSSGGGSAGGGGGGSSSSSTVTTTPPVTTSTGTTTATSSGSTPSPSMEEDVLDIITEPASEDAPSDTLSKSELVFRDITGNWARSYVETLAMRGIVRNTEAYRPDDALTRAEFLKIVGNSAGWDIAIATSVSSFEDVDAGAWYSTYAEYAVSNGIIMKSAKFRPNDKITRAEIAKILVKAVGKSAVNPDRPSFSDVASGHSLFTFVEAAKKYGIFDGQQIAGKLVFRPNDNITRAEIAKVVVRTFEF